MATTKSAVKQPQDHKQKQENPKATEVTFKIDGREVEGWEVTLRGVNVRVPMEALRDMRLLHNIGKIQAGDGQAAILTPSVIQLLVGDQFEEIMQALTDPVTGRADITEGARFVGELFGAINPNG